MSTWSGIKAKLEKDYLAPSLRGHITYFATSYSRCPDHEGRAAILYDGEEILKSNYFDYMLSQDKNWEQIKKNQESESEFSQKWRKSFEMALNEGEFDNHCFYNAFDEFDNQSIEKSLKSENPLVRLFAILDRRVGKRTLIKITENFENELEWLKGFYIMRCGAEEIRIDIGP